MKNKRPSFQFKKQNRNSIYAHRQATMYANMWMKMTDLFNDFIKPISGTTIKCPNISREVRQIYRMFANLPAV